MLGRSHFSFVRLSLICNQSSTQLVVFTHFEQNSKCASKSIDASLDCSHLYDYRDVLMSQIYFDESVSDRIKQIAKREDWLPASQESSQGFLLTVQNSKLSLVDLSDLKMSSFTIDFLEPQFLLRLEKAKHETQLLKRAIGISPSSEVVVWDATAGLGRDAIVLAQLGYKVIAVERSRLLFELLDDGVNRLRTSKRFIECASRLEVIFGDSKQLLTQLSVAEFPDVIYLDPMYPLVKKSARPKKEMQFLRKILGPDDNLNELISISRTRAKKKVIVKNSPRTNLGLKPQYQIESKSVKFDIF